MFKICLSAFTSTDTKFGPGHGELIIVCFCFMLEPQNDSKLLRLKQLLMPDA